MADDPTRRALAKRQRRRIAARSWLVGIVSMLAGLGLYHYDNWYERMPNSAMKTLLDDLEILLMGPGMGFLALALSENARLKDEAHRERLRAEHDARFRMLGRIAASVAHEIRNPLHNLHLIGEELSLAPREAVPPLAARARKNIARLHDAVSLVYELALPAAPRDDGDARDVALAPLVDEVVGDERRRDAGGAAIAVAARAPALVRAREASLRIVLRNLVHNAARAAGPGGRVAVAWSERPEAWELTVTNPGALPPEVLAGDEPLSPQGLGVGLSIARHLAANLGGALRLEQRGGEIVATLTLAKGALSA